MCVCVRALRVCVCVIENRDFSGNVQVSSELLETMTVCSVPYVTLVD